MEFTVKNSDLKDLLKLTGKTYGNKDKPVMDCIYFKTDSSGDSVAITTNGSESTKATFSPKITTDGELCIEFNALSKLSNTFSDGDITLKGDSSHGVVITHPDGELELGGLDPAQFPSWSDPTNESSFVIDAGDFKKALDSVEFARIKNPVGGADAKLGGVGFTIQSGKGTLACTDRRRITKMSVTTPKATDIQIVIPIEMLKTLASMQGNIEVILANNSMAYKGKSATIRGPVIADQFPDVNRFFTQAPSSTIVMPRKSLLDTLERVAILAKSNNSSSDALFRFGSNTLDIVYKPKKGRGKIDESIAVNSHTGNSIAMNLNVEVLVDAFKKIQEDNVEFELHAAQKPVIIYPENNRDYGFLALPIV